MNEGVGDYIYDIITGLSVNVNNGQNLDWITLESYDSRLEICEGERVFSENGYCLN